MNTIQKERQKRDERLKQARRWADESEAANGTAGDPSLVFTSLEEFAKVNFSAGVVYTRVSDERQKHSIPCQTEGIKQPLFSYGIVVDSTNFITEIANGKRLSKRHRAMFHQALRLAGMHSSRTLIIACPSRAARNVHFDLFRNPNAMPTERQYRRLRKLMDRYGVERIVTISDPNNTPDEDEELLAKWGRLYGGRFAGRPVKRLNKKKRLLRRAVELRKNGNSWRKVAMTLTDETGVKVSHNGVRNWVRAVLVD